MPDLVAGLIRTTTTLVVGAGLTAAANWARRELGVELAVDPVSRAEIITGTTAFVSMLYYATFATLERRWPPFGVFLGWPKAPRYGIERRGEHVGQADELAVDAWPVNSESTTDRAERTTGDDPGA